jgi:tetratricopeptide (TPR) repeat protein
MIGLAKAYRIAGRMDEANQAVEGAAKLFSEGGTYATAFRLARAGNAEQFDARIRTLIAQDHEKAATEIDMLVLGELRLVAGEIEAAIQAIRAAITRNNGPDFMYKSLGWALLAQGQATQASEAFHRALGPRRRDNGTFDRAGADPDQMTAAYFLDLVTEDDYVNYCKDFTTYACLPWFYVGQRREIQGKPEDAIAAYKRCIELGPDDNAHPVRWLAEWRLGMLAKTPD